MFDVLLRVFSAHECFNTLTHSHHANLSACIQQIQSSHYSSTTVAVARQLLPW